MYNPYQFNQNQFNQNILPQQQILQANGKSSIDMLKMAPNSSVLIADSTAPIVWKCVSDGLGNVTADAFDITPHKTEEQIQKEVTNSLLLDMNERLKRLEEYYEQSITIRNNKSSNTEFSEIRGNDEKYKKSTNPNKSNDTKQSSNETNK